jgi:nitroreductase
MDRFSKGKPSEAPQSNSGRGHFDGWLDFDEINAELRGLLGIREFDKMYRTDGDVRQAVSLVTNPLLAASWFVIPGNDSEASEEDLMIAADLDWALFKVMDPDLISHIAQAAPVLIRSGYVPFEKVWMHVTRDGRDLMVPKTLGLRLPRTIYRFFQDRDGWLTGIEQYVDRVDTSKLGPEREPPIGGGAGSGGGLGPQAVRLDARNLVYYRIGAEGDNWEGMSMLRPAYKHWKMKDAIERIDAIAQEREAVGIPICYPPLGATAQQLEKMEQILADMRSAEQGYIIAPGPHAQDIQDGSNGWRIELIGFDRQGSGRDPQPSLKYHTDKIASSFIAEFMRLGHSNVGARATAQVQANPFLASIEAFAHIVERTLMRDLISEFVAINYGPDKTPPALKMSLVDSTSLTELADFVQKLIMVGALIPDQPLENFLRDRAELPPPDPAAIKARQSAVKDHEERKEMVVGTDPFGGGGAGGKQVPGGVGAKAGPGQHGGKQTPAKSQGTSLDEQAVTLEHYPDETAHSMRPRHRPLRDYEKLIALDEIEDVVDGARERFQHALRDDVYRIARSGDAFKRKRRRPPETIINRLKAELESLYEYGRQTVRDELQRQSIQKVTRMARESDDERELRERAELAAEDLMDDIARDARHATFRGGDEAARQQAVEQAGARALRRAAQQHAMAAVNLGRLTEGTSYDNIGSRYTAILDGNTCKFCRECDDGELRPLDDPVRIARIPPNRGCHSILSGNNMCRCMEFFEPIG